MGQILMMRQYHGANSNSRKLEISSKTKTLHHCPLQMKPLILYILFLYLRIYPKTCNSSGFYLPAMTEVRRRG